MKWFPQTRLAVAATLTACLLAQGEVVAAPAAAQKKTPAKLASGKASGATKSVKPTTYTVTVDATRFQPDVLRIKPGDVVVWVNKDFFPHTATSKAAGFDSGAVATGRSWSHTFEKSGEFPYTCTLHPTMKGTIRVR
jgi:plastocyanin